MCINFAQQTVVSVRLNVFKLEFVTCSSNLVKLGQIAKNGNISEIQDGTNTHLGLFMFVLFRRH